MTARSAVGGGRDPQDDDLHRLHGRRAATRRGDRDRQRRPGASTSPRTWPGWTPPWRTSWSRRTRTTWTATGGSARTATGLPRVRDVQARACLGARGRWAVVVASSATGRATGTPPITPTSCGRRGPLASAWGGPPAATSLAWDRFAEIERPGCPARGPWPTGETPPGPTTADPLPAWSGRPTGPCAPTSSAVPRPGGREKVERRRDPLEAGPPPTPQWLEAQARTPLETGPSPRLSARRANVRGGGGRDRAHPTPDRHELGGDPPASPPGAWPGRTLRRTPKGQPGIRRRPA